MRLETGKEASAGGALSGEGATLLPLHRVEAFLRQLAHDVRNDLNAMDLLVSYAEDMGGSAAALPTLDQLHGAVRYGSKRMQRIARAFQMPLPDCIPYPTDLLFEDLRDRLGMERPELAARVVWEFEGPCVRPALDPVLVLEAVTELLENASVFSPAEEAVVLRVGVRQDGALWQVRQHCMEAPRDLAQWGVRPMESARRGAYGLGLFRVRRILRAHGAGLDFVHDPVLGFLTAEVFFPGSKG